ncbi:MAG TPA: PDZ domain-containing protein, partial [Blastocatellia bacterium]|nr:PDZ domain-containing protein [Blastocatellia bacterium]
HDFYRKYVSGVEVPPYDTILGYAGYKAESSSRKTAELGFDADETPAGLKITSIMDGGSAQQAGLRTGDILLGVDELVIQKDGDAVMTRLEERMGRQVKLAVKRAGDGQTLDVEVGSRSETGYKISEIPNATAEQLRIRERWLRVSH